MESISTSIGQRNHYKNQSNLTFRYMKIVKRLFLFVKKTALKRLSFFPAKDMTGISVSNVAFGEENRFLSRI